MLPHTPNNNLLMFLGNLLIIPPYFLIFLVRGCKVKISGGTAGKKKNPSIEDFAPPCSENCLI